MHLNVSSITERPQPCGTCKLLLLVHAITSTVVLAILAHAERLMHTNIANVTTAAVTAA
jgi:hypothetical protein